MLDYCIPKYITVTFLSPHITEIPSTFFYLLIFFDFFLFWFCCMGQVAKSVKRREKRQTVRKQKRKVMIVFSYPDNIYRCPLILLILSDFHVSEMYVFFSLEVQNQWPC